MKIKSPRANFHTHTTFCDGSSTAEEMVLQALELGFEQLGFSGHMDPDIHMDWAAYQDKILRLQAEYSDRIEILLGVELDNLFSPETAPGAEYVIGSTHFLDLAVDPPMSVDNTEEGMVFLAEEYFGGDYYKLARAYYDFEAKVVDRTGCTFIGHFDLVTRFNDSMHFLDEEDPRYVGPATDALKALAEKGVPMEINCGAVNRGRKRELYPNRMLLSAWHDFGGQILISSDAHQKELLDKGFDLAAEQALACGFTHSLILTRKGTGKIHWEEWGLRG